MDLQENIHRIKQMMTLISESDQSYTIAQIKKGLDKSVRNNDLTINTSADKVIDNIDKFNHAVGSVGSFLDDDTNFIFHSLPDKLIKYIQDNSIDINIDKLIQYNQIKREYFKNEDDIATLTQTNSEDDPNVNQEIDALYDRNDELYKYHDLLNAEIIRIKQELIKRTS